jgi:hypothetical protein
MNRITLLAAVIAIISGCAHQDRELPPIAEIPTRAIEVRSGAGRLFYQAGELDNGTLYVYDASTARLVFFTPIAANERFVFDPANDRATIEGRPVYEQPLNPRHIHRLFLLVGRTIRPATAPAPGPVLTPPTRPVEPTE